MKKADLKLIITLAAVGLIVLAVVLLCSERGKTVVITQNNKQIYSGSLDEDKTIDLKTNVVEIKDGFVEVKKADCKNQICVKHKKINKKGEQIACIPNKVLITVE